MTLRLVQGDHKPELALNERGGLATDGGILILIYQSFTTRLGTYWADPTFGSRLHEVRNARPRERASLAKAHARAALEWMIAAEFAREVETAASVDGEYCRLTVTVTPSVGPVWSKVWEIQLNEL